MLSIFPLAMVAFVSLADARFGRPETDNNETIRCCPCFSGGLSPNETTVTVTVTSPKETVTIDHTVVKPATTVFVTHTHTPVSPNVVTQEVTVHPEPPVKIETAIHASAGNSEPSTQRESTRTITKTVQPGGDRSESAKTVTVTLKPDQSSAGATIKVAGESKSADAASLASNFAVTVTISPQRPDSQQSAAPSRSTSLPRPDEPSRPKNSPEIGADTVTVAAATQPKVSHTILSTAEPSIKTVTFVEKPSVSSVETVTFVENPANPGTTTVISAGNPSDSGVDIVTFVENPPKPSSTTAAPTETEILPKTSSSSPGIETVTFVDNPPNPTANSLPLQPTITAPPRSGTASPSVDHFTTLTQTVASGGDINIEIIIINILTGETICRKMGSGKPCDSKPKTHRFKPSGQPPCLTTGIVTRTATAFNTVVVTVSPGMWSNGTSPTGVSPPFGMGTGSPVLRRGKVPLVRKRL
ncbi:hypothetical protein V8C37DRAFT_393201 [Trichoderma ceciliae]